jgi:hypothetical protein
MNEFQDELMKDYGLCQQEFDVIWEKAWEDGHSAGLSEVYCHFGSLFDFVHKYMKSLKGI